MSDPHWIEHAEEGMRKKGSLGSFGKATPSKISKAKKQGGVMEKKAIFAQNVSRSNRGQHFTQGGVYGGRDEHYQRGNAIDGRESGMTDGKC